MPTIQVFDPALCCQTGMCSVDVDQALVIFAADVDWLRSHGVAVTRVNLAQQPQAFATHAQVRQLLQAQGDKALPVVVVNGELKTSGHYPSRDELAGWTGAGTHAAPPAESRRATIAIPVVAAAASNASACCMPLTAANGSKCC